MLTDEVIVERIKMCLAEVGIDGSGVSQQQGGFWAPRAVPSVAFWRASQISGHTEVFCYECWKADAYSPGLRDWDPHAWIYSCLGNRGQYDCGRTDRHEPVLDLNALFGYHPTRQPPTGPDTTQQQV